MTTIKDLLSTGHWTDYFLEKPLTFSEFVATSDLPKTAFKTTLEFFDTIDDNIQYQYYFQGCVGSGKSIIIYTLCAYKLYLFCLLRDPHKTFSHAPTTTYSFGIITTKKSSDLALSSLLQIMEMFPIFKKNRYEIDDGPVGYSLNCNNALMRLQYVTKEGIRGADIHVIAISTPGDLMGTNIVGALGTELIAFLQDTEMSEDDLFSFINKIRVRIDNRMRDELPIKCLFIEKAP